MKKVYGSIVLVVVAVSTALAAPAGSPPVVRLEDLPATEVSEVIYPAQQLPLVFSHASHLRRGTGCAACHSAAARSRSSLDDLLPEESACAACHAIDRSRPDASCGRCHAGFDPARGAASVARPVIPPPNLKFDHQAHASRGAGCRDCHGDLVAGVDLATRAQLPPMALCLGCHDGRRASDRCVTCHIAEAGGRIRTAYAEGKLAPSGSIRPDDHGLRFRTDHRAAAEADPGYCESCHRKAECIDCHQGVQKPLDFHAGDYIALHAVDARRGTPDCTACHRLQSFCVGCHARSGVSADMRGEQFVAPTEGPSGRRFHPPGWVEVSGGRPVAGGEWSKNHHALEAERNLRECASCHRESFCLTCHSAQPSSFRINPHPDGWRGSRRCRALLSRARRMCTRCHIDPDELTCE